MSRINQMSKMRKPKDAKKTLLRLISYIVKPYKFQFILLFITVIISSIPTIVGAYLLKNLIDVHIANLIGQSNPDFTNVINFIGVILIIYMLGVLSTYIYSRLGIYITNNVLEKVRIDLFSHMQKLPIKFFDSKAHGELMSRYTNDVDALRQMLSQSLPMLFTAFFTILGVFIYMCVISILLTLFAMLMFVIMFLAVKIITKRSAKYYIKQQKELGIINGYIEEMTEGQKVVKVFNYENESKINFDKLNESLFKASASANTYGSILFPVMGNLGYAHYALTAVVGAILFINGIGGLLVGDIIAFLYLTRNFSQPITQISMQFNFILTALAGAERIFEVFDELEEVDDGNIVLVNGEYREEKFYETDCCTGVWAWKKTNSNNEFEYIKVKGDVRFNNVDFAYIDDKKVLNSVSLFAKPGQKIAFVGSTGAGKTTITNLINRFYDIQTGDITYDGIKIKEIKKSDLRKSLAMVLQDTHLFTGTIKENIKYGNLDASDEDVERAARLANADFFISHLPNGYDTIITSDGTNLSQGQRQLLNIARAAIANPPVLILDEATSSIDTRTEMLIEKGMDELMKNRTVFVIAHRLSTVRNAKAILVLENGVIIERGNHEDLLKQKGKYYKLYTGTFELT
ncbi:MAG: ABC transporter ATP-binding protein [Bacilli bacterium]|nr:ABC transporter ATP-binding protein [Bacilli bacterium]